MNNHKCALKLCGKYSHLTKDAKSVNTYDIDDNIIQESVINQPTEKNDKITWTDDFKNLYHRNKKFAEYWFWDHFDWSKQSLWIGKFNKMNHLPENNDKVVSFLSKLLNDMDRYEELKHAMYIKFYFTRNVTTREADINFLLVCNTPKLPENFSNLIIDVVFEKYQLTESIVNKEENFKNLINHYINWNNFYTYYDLMGEMEY
jgi:hypothetical protein